VTTDTTRHIPPELAGLNPPPKKDGPAAAVILAAGVGIFVLGLFTLLNEASGAVHDFLEGFDPGRGVGPLAGKTILAVVAFALTWLVFGLIWRRKDVPIKSVFWVALALGTAGAVMMFPPVFEAFA